MTTAKDYVSQCGTGTLERPRYAAGMLLEDDDLTAAVDYTRNMMRLMFRSLFGCGVICGLDVTAELTCNGTKIEVTVGKGVALDCTGNPIEVPKAVPITYNTDCKPLPKELWVVVCYCEKCCRPRDVSCSADDAGNLVKTRIMDGFEVRLYDKRPKCVCSCQPPDETEPSTGGCCDDDAAATAVPSLTGGVKGIANPKLEVDLNLPELTPECQCYASHAQGKCDCDCCCPCVLVGNVILGRDAKFVKADGKWVRRIRPMLMAYYNCLHPIRKVIPLSATRVRKRRATPRRQPTP